MKTPKARSIVTFTAPTAKPFKKTPIQCIATRLLAAVDSFAVMLYGGSRSGKTFIIVRSIILRAFKYPGSRHLMLRLHFQHAKTSLWHDTIPKVFKTCFPNVRVGGAGQKNIDVVLNKQDWFIEFSNGSQIWLGGLDDKERVEKILGTEYTTMYFNECSQLSWTSVKLAITRLAQVIPGCRKKLFFDCNPPNKRHWTYSLWIKHQDPETGHSQPNPRLYTSMRMNPADNEENLGEDYVTNVLNGTLNERELKRFRDGEFLDDAEGALFKYSDLNRDRIPLDKFDKNCLDKVVIAVDPAVSNNEDSDYHGIVAVGWNKETDDEYVLEDATMPGTPRQWALKVVEMWQKWDADLVIGEINQGGDLVETNLRTVSQTMPFKMVRATKGKSIRAEPVASMSERGKLHMVGEHPMLEEELTSWVPDIGMKSPNRMDAMVWGCSHFIKAKRRAGLW